MPKAAPRRLVTDDGINLDAELRPADDPWAAAVLCHPHPQFGGSMRAGLVAALFDRLPDRGVSVLRFDFRGVGRSGGRHAEGRQEPLDVAAAVSTLAAAGAERPLVTAGWSFGGDVSLAADCAESTGWFAIAPPLAVTDPSTMVAAHDQRPTLLAVPQHDEFRPPDEVSAMTADWVATEVTTVTGADHLCTGRSDAVADLLVDFLDRLSLDGVTTSTAAGR